MLAGSFFTTEPPGKPGKYLTHVSRMILSSQDMETNSVSVDGLMDKQNVINIYY